MNVLVFGHGEVRIFASRAFIEHLHMLIEEEQIARPAPLEESIQIVNTIDRDLTEDIVNPPRQEFRVPRTIGKPCKGFGPKKTMRVRNICKS